MSPKRKQVGAVFLLLLAAVICTAAQKNQPQLRTVHGNVVDKQENSVPGAIVYVENRKTKVVRTAVADDQGLYRFSGLDPNVDIEIHAERNGMTSSTRTISSFDTSPDVFISLKLDKKKGDQ